MMSQREMLLLQEERMLTQEDVLQMTSLLFLGYAKHKKTKDAQEVQAMSIDGHMLISANSGNEFIAAQDFLGFKTERITLGGKFMDMFKEAQITIKTMDGNSQAANIPFIEKVVNEFAIRSSMTKSAEGVRIGSVPRLPTLRVVKDAPFSESALLFRGNEAIYRSHEWLDTASQGRLHVLSGDGQVHAEQALLLALAQRLYVGLVPQNDVVIRGVKPPCATCRKVLTAFKKAFEIAYTGKKIFFDPSTAGRNDEVAVISLSHLNNSQSEAFKLFQQEFKI